MPWTGRYQNVTGDCGRQGADRGVTGAGGEPVGGDARRATEVHTHGAHAHPQPDERGRHRRHPWHHDRPDPAGLRPQPGKGCPHHITTGGHNQHSTPRNLELLALPFDSILEYSACHDRQLLPFSAAFCCPQEPAHTAKTAACTWLQLRFVTVGLGSAIQIASLHISSCSHASCSQDVGVLQCCWPQNAYA